MLKLARNFFVSFLLMMLISISTSYGLDTEEAETLNQEDEYVQESGTQLAAPPAEVKPTEETAVAKEESVVAKEEAAVEKEEAVVAKIEVSPDSGGPKKVSLDIKGMDILDVLKILSSEGNLNIVTGKNVSGRVSMFLKDVDIWDAFEIIIAANGLAYEKKGSIIKVMSEHDYELIHGEKYNDMKTLVTKRLRFANAKDVSNTLIQIKSAMGKVVVDESSNTLILLDVPEKVAAMENVISQTDVPTELETKVFDLNYAQPDKLKEQLQEVLTKGAGMLKVDERTNKIVVTDYPAKIAQIEQMVKAFDEKTKQVLIEAKIVQVTLSDQYKMGIDWKYVVDKQLNLTAFNISRTLTTTGSQVIVGETGTPTSPHDFKVIIDMLKTFGDAKTLSTPRIMAISGQEAKILVGSKKVYVTDTVTQTNSGTNTAEQVQFIDVGVKLYVTPTINKDGFISMKIRPEVSSASTNYTTAQGNQVPIVETSEAETSVIVKDGITVVMGGLMKNEKTKNVYKLPLLGEIPFLGSFFRRTEDTVTKTELVIFLTPHIISGTENVIEVENK
ncbi:MAG: secretin N-terminal domain-containing protein [Candidatus Omnitrophica bacterium]|nr:secretin N-terminal domain-containing protein [Candidatus Omnitrophota bacterium]MDD5351795.1 secretin N-terminal domain-containing protein [Candidatus Omnitrophota bacterium]MDD5550621.1 secretin N-terminal domain-containing protein [Candidatus Omnitrophota bacterium]